MPLTTQPINNNVLIEVLRDDDGVSRSDANESLKYGRIIKASISSYHLTASSFGEIQNDFREFIGELLQPGSIVRWEEFAEGGQTFVEDGKTYALIPWWRLISIDKETK
jgi:hypothetical protein